ncbi:MAG: RES domain-containing protein [Hyphomonadaceae bacterium]|nr:RES domain-containing protein [Hyphomonadaceae bacterium]
MSDADDVPEVAERRVCAGCVGEAYLKAEIERTGEVTECYYCGEDEDSTITIEELAGRVETALEHHYERTSSEPEGIEYLLQKEGRWSRHGDQIVDVIGEMAGIEPEPAEDVRSLLEDQNYDKHAAEIGEENPFDEEAHYERAISECNEYQADWQSLVASLEQSSRFFSRAAHATLTSIFQGLDELRTRDGKSVVVAAGPGCDLRAIYRARVFPDHDTLSDALLRPETELGPPPSRRAAAGRMNPHGISVFYGAIDEKIACAEVRPAVGSMIASAKFEIIRSVRLLDVSALQNVLVTGSVFDGAYRQRLEHGSFMRILSNRIGVAVLPTDEPFQYLATQAIAEFLSEFAENQIDGLLFRSAQAAAETGNVVLFHRASRVEAIERPQGTEFRVNDGYPDEEDYVRQYTVWEDRPAAEEKKQDDDFFGVDFSRILERQTHADRDARPPTLRIDVDSVVVHEVEAVEIKTQSYPVTRRVHQATKATSTPPGGKGGGFKSG